MKIISPLDNVKETTKLIENGADELYFEVMESKWLKEYSDIVPMNKRGNMQT